MKEISHAIEILEEDINSIFTVDEWAARMHFSSEKYFSRVFRNHFGVRPKKVITEKKLLKIKQCFSEEPYEIFYCSAKKLGFADDQALYRFVKRHTGKSLTQMKRECKKGE